MLHREGARSYITALSIRALSDPASATSTRPPHSCGKKETDSESWSIFPAKSETYFDDFMKCLTSRYLLGCGYQNNSGERCQFPRHSSRSIWKLCRTSRTRTRVTQYHAGASKSSGLRRLLCVSTREIVLVFRTRTSSLLLK